MSDTVNVRCPRCHERLVQRGADGKIRVRVNMLAFSDNGAEVCCRRCGADVPMDIQLGDGLRQAVDQQKRLILRLDTKKAPPIG